ncbi:hypothetical protein [Streptomyces sp. NPDC002205]|uniref:hypothetical protein n=1 Tax=Streptomyces sp. NPDC002205 TaxID=3154411 RepID=UPI00331E6D8E
MPATRPRAAPVPARGKGPGLLFLGDRATPPDEPLLSTLLASDPSAASAFHDVAAQLGLELPDDEGDLRDIPDADAQQLHHLWLGR